MLVAMMAALAMAQGADAASLRTFEGEFRPLKGSEKRFARLGPAGPYFPQRAVDARANGYGLIQRRVGEGGELAQCKLVGEAPRDSNFAPAARIMAERKRIFVSGAEPGETILVRVPFVLGAPAQVAP